MASQETYDIITTAYNPKFLSGICDMLQLKSEHEREEFSRNIYHAGLRYLTLSRGNPKRLPPSEQKKLLNSYKNAANTLKKWHDEIIKDQPTHTKFYKQLREEYNKQSPFMKEMLSPYMTAEGLCDWIAGDFLELLSKTAETAHMQNIGDDKADFTKNLIQYWLIFLRRNWPRESAIRFALGDYLKELKGYKSPSLDILVIAMNAIDDTVERTYLGNIMKDIIEDDINHIPAHFLF